MVILTTMSYFYLVFSFILIYSRAVCEDGKKNKLHSYDKIFSISSVINSSLVFESHATTSLVGCSLFCSNLDSLSFYFIENTEIGCHCNTNTDENVVYSENNTGVVYGYTETGLKISSFSTFTKRNHRPEKRDCLKLYQDGYTEDGVYVIRIAGEHKEVTWCDMKSGGWTVIQRRQDGSENFYRPWNDYVNGFGNRTGEYWIGLENIYRLTLPSSKLRIEMDTFGDIQPNRAYAEYTVFKVGSAATNYRLTINGFSGDCYDALGAYHNGMAFTTYDRDNDLVSYNCALKFKGGWWYRNCHYSNLNGLYQRGKYIVFATGMDWYPCWGHYYSVKTSMIKIQRIE